MLLDEIEAAEAEGNDDRIEGVLCGAVKQLKMNRAKPDTTLYLSLMYLAKIKPNIFATEGVIEVRSCEPARGGPHVGAGLALPAHASGGICSGAFVARAARASSSRPFPSRRLVSPEAATL